MDSVSLRYTSTGQIEVPMANGKVIKIPVAETSNSSYNDSTFNISEEVDNCGVWRSMEGSQVDLAGKGQYTDFHKHGGR